MTEQQQEELAKMYALRAGLSQLAMDADQISDYEKQHKQRLGLIATEKGNFQRSNEEIFNELRKLNGDNVRRSAEISRTQQNVLNNQWKKKTSLKCLIWGIILLTIGPGLFLCVLATGFLTIKVDFGDLDMSVIAWTATLIQGCGIAIPGLISGAKCLKYSVKFKREIRNMNEHLALVESSERAQIQFNNQKSAVLQENITENRESMQLLEVAAVKSQEQCEKERNPYYLVSKTVHNALTAEFSSFIDEKDWPYVDLIIYAYESGRAENLKEAKMYADQERRTDSITEAIRYASTRVCNTIEGGFSKLGQALAISFDRLSEQMRTSSATQLAAMKSIGSQLDGVKATMGTVAAGIDFNNALRQKQNESSTQMYNEIRPMLIRADEFYRDQINNK